MLALPPSQQAYGYYASGADDEWTLRENREALARYRLLPRMLVDVSAVDTSTHLFGEWASGRTAAGMDAAGNNPRQADFATSIWLAGRLQHPNSARPPACPPAAPSPPPLQASGCPPPS